MVHAEFDGGNLNLLMNGLSRGLNDLRPIAFKVSSCLLEGNRQGIGTDWHGSPLAPLKASTLKRREGNGPPLAPHDLSSRIFTNPVINASGAGGQLAVEMSWKGIPWLGFHMTGTKWMAQRNIVGIRPETLDRIQGVCLEYFDDLLNVTEGRS